MSLHTTASILARCAINHWRVRSPVASVTTPASSSSGLDIDPIVGSGRVNVGGEDWAAKSPEAIAVGTTIRVVAADGIVLEVIRP